MADQYSPQVQLNQNKPLTISDVWQQPTPSDIMNMAMMPQRMLAGRIQITNALAQSGMDAGQINKMLGQQGDDGMAQGAVQQADLARQAEQQKQVKEAAATMTQLKRSFGLKNIKANWDNIKTINPLFSKIDPENITDDGLVVRHPDTGDMMGFYDDEGKFQKTAPEKENTALTLLKGGMPKKEDETKAEWDMRVYKQYQADQEKLQLNRIPALAPSSDLPPGYTIDRRKGGVVDPEGKKVSPDKIPDLYGEKAEMAANKKAEGILKPRIELIKTFTKRIDANINLFNNFKSKFKNEWPRIANLTLRQAYAGAIGSGDMASLKQILFSIESEVAKVERGSIGVAGADVESAKIQARIHDLNLPISELEKVLNTSRSLGQTADQVLQQQWSELKSETRGKPKLDIGLTPEFMKSVNAEIEKRKQSGK